MKEIKHKKPKKPFKKLFVKLCRILGYEIIDQSNLSVPTLNKKINDNLSSFNHKSITLPLGEVKITRKVLSLDIIIKTCTSVNLVTQNKKRIFEQSKSEYTFRTINSLINSINFARKTIDKINFNITVIDYNSKSEDLDTIKNSLNSNNVNSKIINLDMSKYEKKINIQNKNNLVIENNMKSTMASIKKSFEVASTGDGDLIYFVEDDYLHKKDSILEMLFTYEKISTICQNEIFLCPVDYPYLYMPTKKSEIFLGHNTHWRTVDESLLTFMTSKKMLNKYMKELNDMALTEHTPFETPLHDIYKNELCLSPLPSLALHCTNVNSVFGLSPNMDWIKIWNDSEKIWDENKV